MVVWSRTPFPPPQHLGPTHLTTLASWNVPDNPTKKLTANKLQFLGMITSEYLPARWVGDKQAAVFGITIARWDAV